MFSTWKHEERLKTDYRLCWWSMPAKLKVIGWSCVAGMSSATVLKRVGFAGIPTAYVAKPNSIDPPRIRVPSGICWVPSPIETIGNWGLSALFGRYSAPCKIRFLGKTAGRTKMEPYLHLLLPVPVKGGSEQVRLLTPKEDIVTTELLPQSPFPEVGKSLKKFLMRL